MTGTNAFGTVGTAMAPTQQLFVRVARAAPAGLGFDAALRTALVPALRAHPFVVELWVGRHGPDELGERAFVALLAHETLDPDSGGADESATVLAWEPAHRLRVDVVARDAPRATILRIARGSVATVDLETYLRDVHDGACRDVERGRGPVRLVVAQTGPVGFMTISTWPDWDAVAAATGASINRPVVTREQHRLNGFAVDHYELLPD